MKIRPSRPKPTIQVTPLRPKNILFTPEEENELTDYIIELQKIVFRLTINDVIIIAKQLAEKYNKKLPIRTNAIMAERLWVLDLMKRYPKINLQIPDINSKCGCFNMAELDYFYKTLSEAYDVKKITPNRIYNTDFIKICIGENNTYIINRTRNKEHVNSVFLSNIITVKVCFNAEGNYMPSIISPQKNSPDLTKIRDASRIVTPNMTPTNELFSQWFRRFIFFSGAKKEQQVLLLFDGKPSYTKSIEIVKITRDNGVNIVSFPPCTENKVQPIDEIFINDLSKAYEKVVETWLELNPKSKLTAKQGADLFDKTLSEEAAAVAAIEAFKRCGIYPLKTDLFTESDFIPVVTKVEIIKEKTPLPMKKNYETFSSNRYYDLYYNPRPGCSFWPD